jgi:hypothetical protein
MTAKRKPKMLTPKIWKFSALTLACLALALSAGCAQQTTAQPGLVAQAAPRVTAPPPAVNPMNILMTQTGDVTTPPVNGNGQPLQGVPGHQTHKDHTYDFGPAAAGGEVCFWDEAKPDKKFCWPNTDSARIFLNPQGDVTHAQQLSGQPISPGNQNAVVSKNWYYGPGTPYCFWTAFGACYCWDV